MSSPQGPCARRVLIIDDNDDAAQLLAMFVGALGPEAKVANDGMSGLAAAGDFMPDVVFLDLGMPGMSGYEVAPRLRQIDGLQGVYIVALTGWNDAQTRQQVVAAGFDKHLTKPAAVDTIHSIVCGGALNARSRLRARVASIRKLINCHGASDQKSRRVSMILTPPDHAQQQIIDFLHYFPQAQSLLYIKLSQPTRES